MEPTRDADTPSDDAPLAYEPPAIEALLSARDPLVWNTGPSGGCAC